MTTLGKIFIYENDISNIRQYVSNLEAQGFYTFGTDNLYKLLKYSEQVNPDVVIMNFPQNFEADSKTWSSIENSLCHSKCPEVYINSVENFGDKPSFHYHDFHADKINEDQILTILNSPSVQNTLH